MPLRKPLGRSAATLIALLGLLAGSSRAVFALQIPQQPSRFDALVVDDPTAGLDVATTSPSSLPAASTARIGWEKFRAASGGAWSVYLDRRSGAPLLVEGQGIAWPIAPDATTVSIAASLRAFIAGHRDLLLADDAELVLDEDASGPLTDDAWQIVFDRAVAGVPVRGERFVFTIGHGSLVAFGATRWSRIDASPFPDLDPKDAQGQVAAYLRLAPSDAADFFAAPALELIPLRVGNAPAAAMAGPYVGTMGQGYTSALVWRVVLRVPGERGTWVALVDAHTGEIRSLVDDNRYAKVKGGIYPVGNDQVCPEGCEQPAFPMPYANITIGASNSTSSATGVFTCTPSGSVATTTLNGQYFKVNDQCGGVSQSVTCNSDLDMATSAGTDCVVPPGSSPGDTHAARSSFYHLNRIAEHARTWLPTRTWLTSQVPDTVNITATCNAYWDGFGVNFFKSGGGCSNTGEISGVFLHEWGHGLDQNDGGDFDDPSEAYADITSIMWTHHSCVGTGFFISGTCSGYGNHCLTCTGVRDQDWDKRANHVPSTPTGFLAPHCPGGGGPCGKEEHCEAYVSGEALWDLATRDLPASGLDPINAWALADKLWYKSRLGSGGNAYNCALPSSDGCGATSWFSKMRAVDDDDGNLANGTPHAAALFAAFNRHGIACGAASDASNQNFSACPTLAAPTMTATAGAASNSITWTAVPGALSYRVMRNDLGCDAGFSRISLTGGTSFTDNGLVNGFSEYYTVQPLTSNASCDGPVSNCQGATPQSAAGTLSLNSSTYNCASVITITVTDSNVGAASTTANLTSTTETAAEAVTLTRIAPGSATYTGTIALTSAAPSHNGVLSVNNGDTITATYLDANDGAGHANQLRTALATADCAPPSISKVQARNVTGTTATISWTTNEGSSSLVHYGTTAPPAGSAASGAPVTDHAVALSGLSPCASYVFSVESSDNAGNSALDNASGSYYTFTTGQSSSPTSYSADTPMAIPDLGSTSSTISVPFSVTVQDLDVTVNIFHPFDGTLTITLVPPTGAPIVLSNQRGAAGANFTNTTFDDEAPTAIAVGSAPFTGSYRPDSPLAAVEGLNSAGAWRLIVADGANNNVGSLQSWQLNFTTSTPVCGPHASLRAQALVADTCPGGLSGNANGSWDAGEQVQFKVSVANDGTDTLTGVSATVTPMTPGVAMVDGTATFPDIYQGSTLDSLAPHFTAKLPLGLTCGAPIAFQVEIDSAQGSWTGSFVQPAGRATNGTGRVLDESFDNGIPATWTVVDGGSGGGSAATWTAANPGVRPIASPLSVPVATVDSDAAGAAATQDEALITPPIDLTTAATATLQFDQYFRWYSGGLNEIADVDVRSAATSGAWVNVLRQQGASSANPDRRSIDISAQAAGAADAQVRFRDYNGGNEWYWQIDNVKVDAAAPGSCDMPVCTGAVPGGAKPVGDGVFGSPMTVSRGDAGATTLGLAWDVTTCASSDHHVLYGNLSSVASATVTGAVCHLGASGSATWNGVPASNLWFVIVGDDGGTTESTWGTDPTSGQRGGATVSGQCGMTARDNSATCP